MRALRRNLLVFALAAAATYGCYQFLLNDEAKQKLQELVDLTYEEAQKLMDFIEEHRGQVMEEDGQPQANKQAVLQQWKSLGL